MEFIKMRKEDTRPCIILYPRTTRGEGEWQKAYFHMWRKRKSISIDEEENFLDAIIEMKDGSMMVIDPKYIKFIDRDESEFYIDNSDKQ